ncbi:MAG: helix-turn-helix domain-containing protein [Candidatus Omnitrophota bacterium]
MNMEKQVVVMNEKKAAEYLGFSVSALQSWRHRGGGPLFFKKDTKAVRYRQADLDRWIEEHLRTSTSVDGSGAAAVLASVELAEGRRGL